MNPGIYYFRLQAYRRYVHQLINSLQAGLGRLSDFTDIEVDSIMQLLLTGIKQELAVI